MKEILPILYECQYGTYPMTCTDVNASVVSENIDCHKFDLVTVLQWISKGFMNHLCVTNVRCMYVSAWTKVADRPTLPSSRNNTDSHNSAKPVMLSLTENEWKSRNAQNVSGSLKIRQQYSAGKAYNKRDTSILRKSDIRINEKTFMCSSHNHIQFPFCCDHSYCHRCITLACPA